MRQFNISVIGLSGTEKDRGQVGVGKSCLCNRFMRPMADDYFIDHISVLSQSDFSGRIVNNDHFLYWGDVRKTTDEGVEYQFNIIEQTEFMDDSTFQAFKVGKMDPYSKRCTATKVFSAEKLMYICKNQLGIEKEYEQKVMPDGRLSIDGFVVVFDVSPVPNRSVEKQVEFVQNVIATILKNKKPLVLVTTKNDDAYELYVREAEKISQRKDYKSTVQLIETSAHESINIDLAFLLLAQMIDKVKNRVKIISYQESAKSRKELLDTRSEAVTRLIRNQITDYHVLWSQGSKMLSQYREWNEFLNIFGHEAGQKLFRRHMKKLRDDHLNKKLHQYLDKFALALEYLLPDIGALNISDDDAWECARNYLQNHIEFEQYFFECPQASWTELVDMDEAEDEARIPFDVLETSSKILCCLRSVFLRLSFAPAPAPAPPVCVCNCTVAHALAVLVLSYRQRHRLSPFSFSSCFLSCLVLPINNNKPKCCAARGMYRKSVAAPISLLRCSHCTCIHMCVVLCVVRRKNSIKAQWGIYYFHSH